MNHPRFSGHPQAVHYGSHVVFVAIFTVTMFLMLALAMEILAVLLDQGGVFAFPWGRLVRLQGRFAGTLFFMLFSGFLPVYVLMYCILLRKLSLAPRRLFSVLIFVLAYIFLWLVISDWSIGSDDWLLLAGVVSVVVSDLLAEIMTRRTAPASLSDSE